MHQVWAQKDFIGRAYLQSTYLSVAFHTYRLQSKRCTAIRLPSVVPIERTYPKFHISVFSGSGCRATPLVSVFDEGSPLSCARNLSRAEHRLLISVLEVHRLLLEGCFHWYLNLRHMFAGSPQRPPQSRAEQSTGLCFTLEVYLGCTLKSTLQYGTSIAIGVPRLVLLPLRFAKYICRQRGPCICTYRQTGPFTSGSCISIYKRMGHFREMGGPCISCTDKRNT